MTGQLFVVPRRRPRTRTSGSCSSWHDGREIRFRDIRKFGKVGLYGRDPVTGELVTEVGGTSVFAALGPGAARRRVHRCASSGDGCAGGRVG